MKRIAPALAPVVIALGIFAVGCSAASEEEDAEDATTDDSAEVKSLKGVTAEERNAYLAAAKLVIDEDIESKDLLKGAGKAFAFNEEVTCDFVDPTAPDELNGNSAKFQCKLADGDVVKVKYGEGPDDNGEIYGEVMSTRLMWALGFAADKMYPVRVTCNNCPADPWSIYKEFKPGQGERATRRFAHAVIEKKFDGAKIEEAGKEDQGWDWGKIGDSPDRNGFKLLGAFMKHADNKAENQRLLCAKDGVTADGKCTKPILMIQDGGVTFGGAAKLLGLVYNASARARYNQWTSLSVWKDRDDCRAELRDARTGTMTHPQIFEDGRAFLAGRLARLSDQQITDLFIASRVEERGEEMDDIRENAPSPRRKVTVDDWRIAFKIHRDEIVKHHCR